jgi:hypothetical protein
MKKYFIKNEFSDHFFYMLCGFCLLLLSLPHQGMAQKKKSPPPEDVIHIVSYEILENGDTINRLDNKNRKEGKWLIVNKGGYGEEDFIELGTYDHNIKMGTWKSYTMNGVIISQEYYKQGNKSGEAKYYDDGMLYCVGNYLALRSLYDYDTIMVEDPITGIEKPVVIKTDVGSVRHGFWTYYDPPSKEVKKVVEYQADEVIYEKEYTAKADSAYIKEKMKSFSKGNTNANQMILEKNKKPSKFTDIPDNAEYVKPNVKKKR